MTSETFTPSFHKPDKRAPRYMVISAWVAPIMVLTGWAFLASVPIALLTWASWKDARVRALRWWVSATAVLYAIPFAQYLTRADSELSMSDMLHPLMGAAIALPAIVVIAKIIRSHRGQ